MYVVYVWTCGCIYVRMYIHVLPKGCKLSLPQQPRKLSAITSKPRRAKACGCERGLAGRVRLRMNRHARVKQRYSKGITADLGHAAGQQRRGRGLQPMEDDGDRGPRGKGRSAGIEPITMEEIEVWRLKPRMGNDARSGHFEENTNDEAKSITVGSKSLIILTR